MRLARIFLLCLLVGGCGYQSESIPFDATHWREEVRFRNGGTFTVARSLVPGRQAQSDRGTRFHWPAWEMSLPDGTLWKSDSMEPLALDKDDKSWIIVATPFQHGDWQRAGCPIPSYVYFRPTASGWHRVNADDVPNDLQLNLVSYLQWHPKTQGELLRLDDKIKIVNDWIANLLEKRAKETWRTPNMKMWAREQLAYRHTFRKTCDPAVMKCTDPACDTTHTSGNER